MPICIEIRGEKKRTYATIEDPLRSMRQYFRDYHHFPDPPLALNQNGCEGRHYKIEERKARLE
jgi:hypothetical protein